MDEDIRKLEKIILNMRPSGIIQNQIVDALKAILWLMQKPCNCEKPSIQTTIAELKRQTGGSTDAAKPVTTSTSNGSKSN